LQGRQYMRAVDVASDRLEVPTFDSGSRIPRVTTCETWPG
jgi:hypothetical protein